MTSTCRSGETPWPSRHLPLDVYQPKTGTRNQYPAPTLWFTAPRTLPAVLVPIIVAKWSSEAKLASISAALLVHSFTRMATLP